MNIHMNRPNLNGDENGNSVGEIDLDKMKSYIAYCKRCKYTLLDSRVTSNISQRSKCAPRLSAEAQEMLSSHFVSLRKEVQKVEQDNDERSSIPITIRFVYFPRTTILR
jgi:DNA replication licensing factor MCM5